MKLWYRLKEILEEWRDQKKKAAAISLVDKKSNKDSMFIISWAFGVVN